MSTTTRPAITDVNDNPGFTDGRGLRRALWAGRLPIPQGELERFWGAGQGVHGRCWVSGPKTKRGYARVQLHLAAGVTVDIVGHRLAWLAKHGPIPPTQRVVHTCDERACVNPDHLELVEAGEVVQRLFESGVLKRICGWNDGHGPRSASEWA